MVDKSISIKWDDVSLTGTLLSFRNYDYYYELILKMSRRKKKIIVFRPFAVKISKESIYFDYRIKHLSNYVPLELVYNLVEDSSPHSFLDKIVHICE